MALWPPPGTALGGSSQKEYLGLKRAVPETTKSIFLSIFDSIYRTGKQQKYDGIKKSMGRYKFYGAYNLESKFPWGIKLPIKSLKRHSSAGLYRVILCEE